MANHTSIDLADCTEFRQTLQGRAPAVVHGTTLLLVSLLGAALAWAAFTKANLVVRAPGRVRPVSPAQKVFAALGGKVEGRVVEVNFQEGGAVRQGDVLLRLDTAALDNEIEQRRRTIQAAEQELAKLDELHALVARQFETAKEKAQAELAQAIDEVRRAKEDQAAEIRLAQIELETAQDREARTRKLVERQAASAAELVAATACVQKAQQKLEQAGLKVVEAKLDVFRRALELVNRDFAARSAEIEARQVVKHGEIESSSKELANLELERERATVRAPLDGIVTSGHIDVGDVLEPGKPAVEVAPRGGFRFEVLVSSEDVGELRQNMPARIKFDAYDYQKYGTLAGEVCFISPDSKFPDEPDRRAAAMYVVKVELAGDEVGRGDLQGLVKLGMAGQVEIVTQRESLLATLVKKIRHTISLG